MHSICGYVLTEEQAKWLLNNTKLPPAPANKPYWFMAHGFENEEVKNKILDMGPIVHVETDYFGGCGKQKATFISKEKTQDFVPRFMDDDGWDLVENPGGVQDPINQALKLMGVVRTEELDEFDVVGLGLGREDRDWIAMSPNYRQGEHNAEEYED